MTELLAERFHLSTNHCQNLCNQHQSPTLMLVNLNFAVPLKFYLAQNILDSSSDESIDESVYSDEDFEQDSMDELADKSIVSVKSDKSTKSTKSTKSVKSTKSTKSDKSTKSEKSTKSAKSTKSVKSTTSEKSKSEKVAEPVVVAMAAPVESTPSTQPQKAPQVTPLASALAPLTLSEPTKPPVAQTEAMDAKPTDATVTLGKIMEARTETASALPVPAAEDNTEKTVDINATISERMKNQAKTMGTSKSRPISAPVGSRLQKMMASRRAGKAKLPENYNGLGSTAMLNELERFKTNALNLELQELL